MRRLPPALLSLSAHSACVLSLAWSSPARSDDVRIVIRGTVVTMDSAGTVLKNGGVLIRGGFIVATWAGSRNQPPGTQDATVVDLGPKALIFPGLIDLHDHPTFDMLEVWPAPSSQKQPNLGRPEGTEPYANRYQWNSMKGNESPEFRRLIGSPSNMLTSPVGLGLFAEVVKYAEIKALLGGETAIDGGGSPATSHILIRNIESDVLSGDKRVDSRVLPIDSLSSDEVETLLDRMRNDKMDAWLVHLAEGVRDGQRRPNDSFSSRGEFATLQSQGLLTDMTAIVHGNGLEPEDFVTMRSAPSIRLDGTGDGLGAKLVWSPLSEYLLYGQTALVYEALAAGLVVSLGTDWSPSGSRTLLDELKIADIALRDFRLLGSGRELIPQFGLAGKSDDDRKLAEAALDKQLVEMVTTNPAKTLRWSAQVGSIEAGKRADLLVITKPGPPTGSEIPDTPYRNLIDATDEDVRLVTVDGIPLAGDVAVMSALKPEDYEVVTSAAGCFQKAIDVTNPISPKGDETFATIQQTLRDALKALGGDHPPAGGGPADATNTYTYLKQHVPALAGKSDAAVWVTLVLAFGLDENLRLNLEALQLTPVMVEDDDFYFHLMAADVTGRVSVIDDNTPPFKLYPSNFNQVTPLGNPFAASAYRDRYYDFCLPRIRLPIAPTREALTDDTRPSPSDDPGLSVAPNPARDEAVFEVDLPVTESVALAIHDVSGRRLRTIVEARLPAGHHRLRWDLLDDQGRHVRAGVYFARWRGTPRQDARCTIVVP